MIYLVRATNFNVYIFISSQSVIEAISDVGIISLGNAERISGTRMESITNILKFT